MARPTINDALDEFLTEQRRRLSASTYRKYEDVVGLLRRSLDGYAYQSLSKQERAFWEKRWKQDEEAGSFCNTFGPEKIPENLGEFLGYFMIRKVIAGKDLLRAAGTVTKKLASWLAARGYVTAEEAEDARQRGAEAARDLPRADELTELLHWTVEDSPPERVREEWEDVYPVISRVEPDKLWFQGLGDDREIGPVAVPAKASELAREEWAVSALLLGRTRRGWQILELGNVYPQ